jgi:hypothetical protein
MMYRRQALRQTKGKKGRGSVPKRGLEEGEMGRATTSQGDRERIKRDVGGLQQHRFQASTRAPEIICKPWDVSAEHAGQLLRSAKQISVQTLKDTKQQTILNACCPGPALIQWFKATRAERMQFHSMHSTVWKPKLYTHTP